MELQRTPVITVILSTDMAWAYAQFLKRVGLAATKRWPQASRKPT